MSPSSRSRRRTHILRILLALLLLALLVFVAWAVIIPSPTPEALAALSSDAQVAVETGPWLIMRPLAAQPGTGLILYPGGRVDARAYAPAARAIAAHGYFVAIVPMPLNLAVLGADRAQAVIDAHPEITRWAIGGHSLGGAMAAQFAYQHPDQISGLVLWAAYPSSANDLSESALQVTSISGTLDGLSTPAKIEASRPLLPPSAQWVVIEGGNHAQFGWYGAQAGDAPATIDREEQQQRIVEASVELLDRVRLAP